MKNILIILTIFLSGCATGKVKRVGNDILDVNRKTLQAVALGTITGPIGVFSVQSYDNNNSNDMDTIAGVTFGTILHGGVIAGMVALCGPCAWWYVGYSGGLGLVEQLMVSPKSNIER